jgi:UDP-glucose 4-epimerase
LKTTVIGNTGFIGSNLSKALIRSGIPTTGFNSSKPIYKDNGALHKEVIESDSIFWAAGKLNPITAKNDSFLVEQELELWSKFISALENSWTSMSGKKLLFLSSGGCVYDYSLLPVNEESPANGSNDYGRAKVQMEKILLNSTIPSSVLRLSNVYGYGQRTGRGQGVIAEWMNAIDQDLPVRVFGDLGSSRDYLHIDDLTSALLLCLRKPHMGILNLGSGKATTLQEVLESFSHAYLEKIKIQYEPGRESDKSSYSLDISKAESYLGWKPLVGIEQGIYRLISETQNAD